MREVSQKLQFTVKKDLRTYLEESRSRMIDLGDGTEIQATWDDVAFWLRRDTGIRIVRESVRNWAHRYGIKPRYVEEEAGGQEPAPV